MRFISSYNFFFSFSFCVISITHDALPFEKSYAKIYFLFGKDTYSIRASGYFPAPGAPRSTSICKHSVVVPFSVRQCIHSTNSDCRKIVLSTVFEQCDERGIVQHYELAGWTYFPFLMAPHFIFNNKLGYMSLNWWSFVVNIAMERFKQIKEWKSHIPYT